MLTSTSAKLAIASLVMSTFSAPIIADDCSSKADMWNRQSMSPSEVEVHRKLREEACAYAKWASKNPDAQKLNESPVTADSIKKTNDLLELFREESGNAIGSHTAGSQTTGNHI
jgi:hypothetical protein